MSAISTIKKYIILAVSGALIIGIGTFLLLNNYFERVRIVTAKTDILTGQELKDSDLDYMEYYKNSLPAGYITKKDDVIGKKVKCERKEGDPITVSVFGQEHSTSIVDMLEQGEVLMALDVPYIEPIVDELAVGSRISIVSTEKEKPQGVLVSESVLSVNATNAGREAEDAKKITEMDYSEISRNITVIDGQVIIKNLEIVDIRTPEIKQENLLAGSKKNSPYIFIKCSINEAPVISRVTKEDKYKIFMEKT